MRCSWRPSFDPVLLQLCLEVLKLVGSKRTRQPGMRHVCGAKTSETKTSLRSERSHDVAMVTANMEQPLSDAVVMM